MKVSLNWLREFVELPSDTAALCDLLTLAGVEVEGIKKHGVAIETVVVAQILESVQHPNADRLSVCKVDDGSDAPRQIVCGAKNFKIGDKVPLARPGAVLPGDFKIKVGKLRGVESQGMLCSANELNLPENVDGLLILPDTAQIGAPLSELYPADTILEIEITPNRSDLLSYTGLAREVAALTGNGLNVKGVSAVQTVKGHVSIEALEECPFYSAQKISGVRVGASPEWLKRKLEASGIRSINNIVDITNFVMLEKGQPLHAFDADRLHGGIHVRLAKTGEEFLALDGRNYKLQARNLVIADDEHAVAIAGVMGGEETGVSEGTTNVILESAYFRPSSIRRTARDLGITSDSSYRFERGVDPEGAVPALQRAAELIAQFASGSAMPTISIAGSVPDLSHRITLSERLCSRVLGTEVPEAFIVETLTRFGLSSSGYHVWHIPSFRQDLTREIDLVEEITRVFGIGNIPARYLSRYVESTAADRAYDRDLRVRRALTARGFHEARTLSLVGTVSSGLANDSSDVLRVRNPLTQDQVVLRPELVGGLLGVIRTNVSAGARSLRLFELGRIFVASEPQERTHLAMVITGPLHEKYWREDGERDVDIFDLKGMLSILNLGELAYEPLEHSSLAVAAAITLAGERIGVIGQLWPAKARAMDITGSVVLAEIELPMSKSCNEKYSEIPKYPAVKRDIAIVAPKALEHSKIASAVRNLNEPLLTAVELFDVFTDPSGTRISAEYKSMAYSLTYRSKDRTLTTEEVNVAHARLKEYLKAELKITFRE